MSQADERGNTLRRYFTTKPRSQMHHWSLDCDDGSVNQAQFCPEQGNRSQTGATYAAAASKMVHHR